jgi:hypothetical protein
MASLITSVSRWIRRRVRSWFLQKNRCHGDAALPFGDHKTFADQAQHRFPNRADAKVVAFLQLGDAQVRVRRQAVGEDVVTEQAKRPLCQHLLVGLRV